MAIISVGYDGAVTESQWSEMIKKIGSSEYGVVGTNDWKVTSVTAADRTISIAPGKGWGHGVYDESTAAVQIQLDTVASGSRWDLIAMRRDWSGVGGVSTFVKVVGTAAKELPALRAKGPGSIDEQPIALVRVVAGQTAVAEIVDLRCWSGNGGMVADNWLALTYLDTLGTHLFTNNDGKKYQRIIGADGNPLWTASAPDGYIPMFGSGHTLAGGIPANLGPGGQGNFMIQAGTAVNYFDQSGYARITFPRAFPNGLLYVAGFNGDDWATGGSMTYASAGSVWGNEGYGTRASWVYAGRAQDAADDGAGSVVYNRLWCAGRIHRINWLAIGW